MLSYAGKSIGAGWVFGLNEALDQAGATVGPLLIALILYLNGGFRTGFGLLLIPALLCLAILVAARLLHPRPHELEEGAGHTFEATKLTRTYWIYLAAGALLAAGFADFALIGFHFHKANIVSAELIPVFYAVAMASGALASIPLGRIFDRFGPTISLFAFLISAAAAPLVFLGTSTAALIGMIFWGIGMSAQGSLLPAMLTGVIPPQKRSTAFGLFDTGYGIAWFVGSAVMGLLYDKSILAVALFSVGLQLAALPILFIANRQRYVWSARTCPRFSKRRPCRRTPNRRHGSVRKAKGAKSRRASAEDQAPAAGDRAANTARTTGREGSDRGGAARD
jgi:predicted MFS family arabinose efflux permease